MNNIILVKDRLSGEISDYKVLVKQDPTSDKMAVSKEIELLIRNYPPEKYEIIRGWGNSIKEFLEVYPEYDSSRN